MSTAIVVAFFVFFCVRLSSLFISIKNERRLKQAGAQEYGNLNTTILAVLHVVFYLGAFAEGYVNRVQFDQKTVIGIGIYVFSLVMLFYVIRQLSPIWTVKLIIAKDHPLNKSFIFRSIRHPNYLLNIIPELIGLALVMKSYVVLLTVFPVYLVSLGVRIVQEEKQMRSRFEDY
jgi:isoprenylcysteine carboxyl methyltransferase (ICMT) family protein YpbQ